MPGYFLALPGLVDPTVAMALLWSKMLFFLIFKEEPLCNTSLQKFLNAFSLALLLPQVHGEFPDLLVCTNDESNDRGGMKLYRGFEHSTSHR